MFDRQPLDSFGASKRSKRIVRRRDSPPKGLKEARMSDQAHPAAVRLQSSAMVAAALITTLGAISAAFIQTGLFNRAPTASVSDFQPTLASTTSFRFTPSTQPTAERSPLTQTLSAMYMPQGESYSRPTPHIAEASFVGTIQPVSNTSPKLGADVRSEVVRPDSGTQFTPAPSVRPSSQAWGTPTSGVNSSAAVNTAAFITPAPEPRAEQTVGYAPALRPQEAPVKILPSPWSFISATQDSDHATADAKLAVQKPEQPTKAAAKKSLGWDSLARLWPWHG
jgi:hypothetical protein